MEALVGRQIVDCGKRQADAGDIVLLFGDKSAALTHPCFARP